MTGIIAADDAPLLIFGGPYSNLQATEALLAEARRLGIPAERTICTGDVVAYGADPCGTVDAVRAAGIPVVMGNCEESLGTRSEDCGCGFAEGSACDALSARWFAHADSLLDEERRAWMRALPRRLDVTVGGRRLAVIHGSVRSINRFVFASTPETEKAAELDAAGPDCDGVIGGHCGVPFTQVLADGRLWHNAGAIGMPANDGTARVWYSLLRPEAGGISVEQRPLEYDHATAAARMQAAGLPEGYASALATGLWPSCDVLPPDECAERGKPLQAGTVFWPGPAAARSLALSA